jgi:hypothetical protein
MAVLIYSPLCHKAKRISAVYGSGKNLLKMARGPPFGVAFPPVFALKRESPMKLLRGMEGKSRGR